MTSWFLSDPHLGHGKVLIGPRGDHFPDVDDWNRHILGECRRLVTGQDRLYILGDLSMERPELWVNKLPKNTWLIHGNHDGSYGRCVRAFGQRFRPVRETKLADGRKCWLSHYAHAFWPASHHGAYHLYGHTHDQREDTLDQWMPQRRSMDCCPETVFRLTGEFRPISEHEIIDILGSREGHDQVDFYRDRRGEYVSTPEEKEADDRSPESNGPG